MASAATTHASFDPTRSGKYPIIISERLLNSDENAAPAYANIQLNYEPPIPLPNNTLITPSITGRANVNLTVTSPTESSTYTYTGSQGPSQTCILLFDPTTQTFTLDKISTDFALNLRSTPTTKSAKALVEKYPQLETTAPDPGSEEDDEEQGLADEAASADPDNPYDYRHYLKPRSESPEAMELASRNVSRAASPMPPVRAKEKPKQKPKPKPERRKAPIKRPTPPPREEADADDEEEDDGGLQIIMDGSTKPHRRFPAGTFSRNSGEAPRSMRSAASSVSPAVHRRGTPSDESDEDMRLPSPVKSVQSEAEEEDDAVEGDASQGLGNREREDDGMDLEAELERELAQGPEGDDDGGVNLVKAYMPAVDSSSESEEE